MNELTKEVRECLGLLNGLRKRVSELEVPEDFDHLQNNALDGLYSAVGYLETLASRAEGNED